MGEEGPCKDRLRCGFPKLSADGTELRPTRGGRNPGAIGITSIVGPATSQCGMEGVSFRAKKQTAHGVYRLHGPLRAGQSLDYNDPFSGG